MSIFLAGAGRAEIALSAADLPLDGFGRIRDPLFVRVLLLGEREDHGPAEADADGVGSATPTAVLVAVDQTSLAPQLLQELRAAAVTETGAAPERVLVAATHTFNAPHVQPDRFTPPAERPARDRLAACIREAVTAACREAVETLQPARVASATGSCGIAINRDQETASGWWHGADPRGPRDDAVPVIRVEDTHGRPIAVVTSVAVQYAVLNGWTGADGLRPVSSDLTGATAGRVESSLPGCVALVLTGAAGDQAPVFTAHRFLIDAAHQTVETDLPDAAAETLLDLLSERLATEIVRTAHEARPTALGPPDVAIVRGEIELQAQRIPADIGSIRPTRSWAFEPAGTTTAPWAMLRLGDAVLVGVQAEWSASTGLAVRRASGFPTTLVATMVDGAAKYMADAGAYDRLTYEAMNSRYARGSAERMADRVVSMLESLRR